MNEPKLQPKSGQETICAGLVGALQSTFQESNLQMASPGLSNSLSWSGWWRFVAAREVLQRKSSKSKLLTPHSTALNTAEFELKHGFKMVQQISYLWRGSHGIYKTILYPPTSNMPPNCPGRFAFIRLTTFSRIGLRPSTFSKVATSVPNKAILTKLLARNPTTNTFSH